MNHFKHINQGSDIFVNGGTLMVYSIFRDNLGTMTHLKSATETLEYSFDAFGRKRDPATWELGGGSALFADRGFTGHEHLNDYHGLINMNGRLYDPQVGRFLSPDNYVQAPGSTQSFNRYSYCLNNPLRYTDPSGDMIPIWVIPNIGWSKAGGLSIGMSVVVGAPGGLSGQAGIGYSFGSNDLYGYIGATAAMNTVSASYSLNSGGSVGYTFGLSSFSGLPISTNFGTVGVNYNISNNSWSGNVSAWQVDQSGWSFNPSVSAMVCSEQTTNLVRGQGFRSNDAVLSRFVAAGNQQGALDYWGFEGTYRREKPNGGKYVDGEDYYGATNPSTGDVSYGMFAFDSYDNLYSVAIKEAYTSERVRSGVGLQTTDLPGMKNYPEEALGFRHAFKNSGLYSNSSINNFQLANSYWFQCMGTTLISNNFFNLIYKIPRKW